MSYAKTDIITFGRHLIETNDLDPIYVALWRMKEHVERHQIERWLFAYWCFYHAGFASWISESDGDEYWDKFMVAAVNKEECPVGGRWPRAKERRYFRGDACVAATKRYCTQDPEKIVQAIATFAVQYPAYDKVAENVQRLPLFGPWISFKVADMLERVLNVHVDFNEAAIFMFKDPTEAVFMLWRHLAGKDIHDKTLRPPNEKEIIHSTVEWLTKKFNTFGYKAEPARDRPLGLQEIETVLCKWKSHMRGHYPYHNDKTEINEGLQPWVKVSPTAKLFAKLMPKET